MIERMERKGQDARWRGMVLEEDETVLLEIRPSFRGNALNYLVFFFGLVLILGEASLELAAGVATAALVHYALHAQTRWALSNKRLLAQPGLFRKARSVALAEVRELTVKRLPLDALLATAQVVVTPRSGAPLLIWRQAEPEALRTRLQRALPPSTAKAARKKA